jgi:hypothetical protein
MVRLNRPEVIEALGTPPIVRKNACSVKLLTGGTKKATLIIFIGLQANI